MEGKVKKNRENVRLAGRSEEEKRRMQRIDRPQQ